MFIKDKIIACKGILKYNIKKRIVRCNKVLTIASLKVKDVKIIIPQKVSILHTISRQNIKLILHIILSFF